MENTRLQLRAAVGLQRDRYTGNKAARKAHITVGAVRLLHWKFQLLLALRFDCNT